MMYMKISKEQYDKLPEDLKQHFYNEVNFHCTTKPIKLMQYLVRLVTPKWWVCLDPYMWSGSTGIGAKLWGFDFIGIEREEEYVELAKARIEGREPEEEKQWKLFE